jgi:CheY-like chemotaxis protein
MSKRIVVLEDQKELLELMEMVLEEKGYEVIAINHHEPLEFLIDFLPDLILLDIRLPNGYGHILCEDMKTNPVTSKIPVILVSGADNLEKIANEYKADGYLSKPFNSSDLISCVTKYLNPK